VAAKLKAELHRLKKELKDDDQFANELPPDGVDGPFPDRKTVGSSGKAGSLPSRIDHLKP